MSNTTIQGYRISPEQTRLWLLQQQSSAYVSQAAIRIEGPVDVAALEAAIAAVVDRLEILRTTFRLRAGMRTPLQVISDSAKLSWRRIDWSGNSRSLVAAALDELLAEQRKRSVNLDAGPVLELCLATVSAQEHYLVLCLPSLCADAASLNNLFEEVVRAYGADPNDDQSEELLQYADFAEWHHGLLDEGEESPAKTYWREQRLTPSSLSTIRRVRKSEPRGGFDVAITVLPVDRETALAAESLARDKSIPVSDFYLACWQTLVWRLSGQADVAIGAVADERGLETLRNACGLFSTTLPVRHRFDDGVRFDEVFDAVARSRRAASDWQYDFSWERNVEGGGNNREPGFFPLAFQFHARPLRRNVGAVSFSLARSFSCADRFDIKLNCVQNGDAIDLEWHSDARVVPPEEIERLSRHYQALVRSAAANPRAAALDLEVLDEAQRQEIVVGFNASRVDASIDRCVHERFEDVARRDPDRPALVFEQQVLSYGELNARSNQLAHNLRSLGVGPDVRVGLCVERSPDMILGILGILKAGGAYVPLDHSLPSSRLTLLIEDSRARLVVCQQHLAELFSESHAKCVVLNDDASGGMSRESKENCSSGVTPANLVYTLFTSGSTGTPKGVLIEHRQLLNYVDGVRERLQLPPDVSFATVSSYAADLGNTAIFPALLSGGCLHIISEDRVMDPAAMAEYGERHGIDCLKIVPSHLAALLSAPRPERVLPRRRLVLGGEASTWDLVNRVEALSPECQIMNHYGPTETTVGVLMYRHGRGHQRADESDTLPLGRPLGNSQVYLLDSRSRPVPIGVSGELHIGGAGLARGYVNGPDQTAASFVPNPFSPDPGARMYRTGDVARYLRDGNVEFLGRADHQVKIRGFRVELGEIESVLAQHPSVEAAIVLAREDVPGDKRLAGYVVRRRGAQVTPEQLRDYARERLPEYMVPSAIAVLDHLPLNRNGKVDRGALPPITLTTDHGTRSAMLPRTASEKRLMEIWSEVLGNRSLGVHDDFFESGGHSLLAMQLIVRVREAFHVDVPLPALFDTPTVAGLAQCIESLIGAGETKAASLITSVSRNRRLPLSFAQQRLWFLEKLEPDAVAYNRTFAIRLRGSLNRTALEQTLGEILRRHEVLRTTYPEVDGKAVQVIAPPTALSLPFVSLAGLSPAEQDANIRRLIQEDARRRFDLAQGPLVRAALLQLGDVDHVLISSQHHINTDAWSNGVYLREISSLHAAFADGRPSPLDSLPIQYADYAVWQREGLEGGSLQAQLSYWKQELQNVPSSLDLPTDRPRPVVQTFHGARREFSLPLSQSKLLKELSAREGTTLFMTLLAAFQTLLHRYTGHADILVGSPIAGRTRPEVEGLIGFFVNTLVLRAHLSGNPTFLELLAQVRERALQAYAHQDVPFEKLVDELEIERDLSRTPLFQVMFVLQTDAIASLNLPGLELQPLETDIQTAKFDLTLHVLETDRGLNGSLEYNTDLFDASSIDRMLGHFKVLIGGITSQPERRLAELPLLPDSERQQLLVEWNDTRVPYRGDVCVHQLFEARVEATPDAVAVVFQDQQVTYRALNGMANQHARYLSSLGVKSGVLVGLFMERSVEMVAGLLGVLKSGGAYVPLDPSYPMHRLQFMLEDSGVTVVLTQDRLRAKLPETSAAVHCVDSESAHASSEGLENPKALVTPGDLAYVIYTSGSTGTPKGAMIEHRGVLNYLNWCADAYPVAEGVGSPVQSSIGFDATITSFFTPLLAGRSVFLLPEEQEVEALSAALSSGSDFSLVKLTPAHLKMLNQMVPRDHARGGTRAFILGGEALVGSDVAFWRTYAPDSRLINEYGPTETVVGCCTYEVPPTPASGAISIGRPIHNTQAYVFDSALNLTPIGVPGELHIGGAGVGRGYLNRPDLTADRFLPHPFSELPGARLYRTGDLVRYHSDSNLEFMGRLDDQVKIRGYRIEPGEIESVLSQHANVREVVVVTQEERPGSVRLVAYWTCKGHPAPTITELRNHLLEKLPSYMVPAVFVMLEKLPLTSNGKLDRRALPKPDQTRPDLEQDLVVARTPLEETLSGIWSRVLGLERVGVHDNFFQLGGDSILSIQIISQANQAGLRLKPKDIFQHQTIAELAATAGTAQVIEAEQGQVTGPVPLTAIQRWFFEQEFTDPHHFNQAVLLQAPTALDPGWLEAALKALLEHHDVLRHSFQQEGSAWHQSGRAVSQPTCLSTFDLSALSESEQALETERVAGQLQQSLHLSQGPLVRAAQIKLGPDGPVRLLLVIHHLVVDGVSWRILLEDLQTAYEQVSRGETIRLPAKTTSFAHFSKRCAELANSPSFQRELDYWLARPASRPSRLPVDHPQGHNTVESSRSTTVSLNPEETGVLLREVPAVYQTQMNDVLLTALVEAFAKWTGSSSLVIDLEGHGREGLFADVDLSRTVGWFTALFPVRLEVSATDDPSLALKSVKEQLRAVPNRGIGYGLLRYLSRSSERVERLRSQPQAEVLFNYLGQVDRVLPETSRFQWAHESSGPTKSHRARRSHLVDVRGMIGDGSLQVSFQYSEDVFRCETIEQLARWFIAALRSLISHCQSPEAGGYTPSDFALANLTQSEIDRHFGNDRTVEDVYALSPLQEGVLFHCLRAPNSGAYVTHLVLRVDGALDVRAFQRAWDRLIARHTVLRTGFLWDQVGQPVQIVRRDASVEWSEEDWREADDNVQRADLRAFLKKDRIQGFDLSKAPLIRLSLMRIADNAYYFVWTHHHLVMDGWSVPVVLKEVLELYKASLAGVEAGLPAARPFRDYIAWLRQQDLVKAESYWRKTLAGLEVPTSMGVSSNTDEDPGRVGNVEYESRLPAASTRSLKAFARQHDLTVNTVVQGAWALLLGAYSGEDDVVYGVALSGRPSSLTDVARIPGMFTNTLPTRVAIDADLSVRQWLGRLQEQQVELREYEYSPLAQVQGWSQIPRSVPLFDVIVGFQNFPVDKTLIEEAAGYGLGIELVLSQEQSTSPVTLFLSLEEELNVRLVYDPSKFDGRTIAGIADRYLRILEAIIASGDTALMDLRIEDDSKVPQLPTMAILSPSAEELRLLSSDTDMESITSERED